MGFKGIRSVAGRNLVNIHLAEGHAGCLSLRPPSPPPLLPSPITPSPPALHPRPFPSRLSLLRVTLLDLNPTESSEAPVGPLLLLIFPLLRLPRPLSALVSPSPFSLSPSPL